MQPDNIPNESNNQDDQALTKLLQNKTLIVKDGDSILKDKEELSKILAEARDLYKKHNSKQSDPLKRVYLANKHIPNFNDANEPRR